MLTAQGTLDDSANPGKINIMNGINMNVAANTITTGNQFAIAWFDSNVTSPNQFLSGPTAYGLITDPSWTIPAAGSTRNISSFFAGLPTRRSGRSSSPNLPPPCLACSA